LFTTTNAINKKSKGINVIKLNYTWLSCLLHLARNRIKHIPT